MLVYVVAMVVAIAVVPLTDGSFERLTEVKYHRAWLLAAGLGLQVALAVIDLPKARLDDVGAGFLVLSYVALLGFCAANIRTRGIIVIGIGIGLNALVIALNLGMPYQVVPGIPRETTIKHRPERTTDILPFLSDRFAFGSPISSAISIGDLVLFAGIVEFAYANSRRARRRIPIRTRYVELPAIEAEDVVDIREPEPQTEGADATIRSSASMTRESYTNPGPE
ncbi:MAG: DUF5317 family protein [Acidimicrobiia bacterium]|nr:DUF5317 family protein [Acidimicrobiia bacterium]